MLKIETAILCEDIRQEKSNKFILIGVYAGEILVSEFPAPISLSLYINGRYDSKEGQLWLRLTGPGSGSAVMRLNYEASADSEYLSLTTPVLQVLMQEEGTLTVETSEDGESWSPLLSRKIIRREGLWSLATIGSLQPSEQPPSVAPDSSSQP